MGLRGAGKTTVASAVAGRLGREMIDLDELVLRALSKESVTDIFEELGERAFREAEASALARTLEGPAGSIVALGGGTPTAPGAASMIRAAQSDGRAISVYLHAPPEFLAERLRSVGVGDRPKLVDGDIDEEMRLVYGARDPLYRDLADRVINAARNVDDVVADVLLSIESLGSV